METGSGGGGADGSGSLQEAVESYAEAWVAANTATALTLQQASPRSPHSQTQFGSVAAVGEEVEVEASGPAALLLEDADWSFDATAASAAALTHGGGEAVGVASSSDTGSDVDTCCSGYSNSRLGERCAATSAAGTTMAAAAAVASSHNKCVPVHCLVEQVSAVVEAGGGIGGGSTAVVAAAPPELDTYAILPAHTPFLTITTAALTKLGYSPIEATTAKGLVELPRWKPLQLSDITGDCEATVQDILGDVSNLATLRIRVHRCIGVDDAEWTEDTVRLAICHLLTDINQVTLARISPLSQPLISSIMNNRRGKVSRERCVAFATWYKHYCRATESADTTAHQPPTPLPTAESCERQQQQQQQQPSSTCQQGQSRLTFHPKLEIPLLRTWYSRYQRPSAAQFARFARHLNRHSAVRASRERAPVSEERVRVWWKNERQRLRRLRRRPATGHRHGQGRCAGDPQALLTL